MTMRDWIESMFPNAHRSHRWMPEWDHDNIECADCGVRPYNDDAARPCRDDPGHGGEER